MRERDGAGQADILGTAKAIAGGSGLIGTVSTLTYGIRSNGQRLRGLDGRALSAGG